MKKKYAPISNSKWRCIAMEQAKQGRLYAFSINPEAQPALYESNRIQKWYARLIKDLSKVKHAEFVLKLEMSRLGRLHYHGTLKITCIWKFYLSDLATLATIGTFDIGEIESMDEWQRYMDKNEIEMREMCKAHDIPLTIDAKQIKNVVSDKLDYDKKIVGIQKKITELEYLEEISMSSSSDEEV